MLFGTNVGLGANGSQLGTNEGLGGNTTQFSTDVGVSKKPHDAVMVSK